MQKPTIQARRERVWHFLGVGALLQAIGLLAPFVLGAALGVTGAVMGVLILVALFIVGSSKATSWRCGNCKNPLATKAVRICPTCKAEIVKPGLSASGVMLGLLIIVLVAVLLPMLWRADSPTAEENRSSEAAMQSETAEPQENVGNAGRETNRSAHSFDCAEARSDSQRLICSDPELRAKDAALSRRYEATKTNARARLPAEEYNSLLEEGDEASRQREAQCHDKECIASWYLSREAQLSAWDAHGPQGATHAEQNAVQVADPSTTPRVKESSEPASDAAARDSSRVDDALRSCLLPKAQYGQYSSYDGGKSAAALLLKDCPSETIAWVHSCQAESGMPKHECTARAAIMAQTTLKSFGK